MLRRIWAVVPPILAIGLLTFAFPPQTLGLQLSDLQTLCRTQLRDTTSDTNFQRFSNTTLNYWINEGQRDAQNKTWMLQSVYGLNLVSGQQYYQTPPDFLFPIRVLLSNKRITQTNFNQLDSGSGSGSFGGTNWTVLSSTPTQYFLDTFQSSVTMMGFYPNPASASNGAGVTVQYAQIPQTLVNLTDVPFDGKNTLYAYHDMLIFYCAMKGWISLDRDDLASGYASLYTAAIATAKTAVGQMPDFNPGAQGYTGPPGQR